MDIHTDVPVEKVGLPESALKLPSPPQSQQHPLGEMEDIIGERKAHIEAEALSENETEIDQEEAEAHLDTCPSPHYKFYPTCTPAYEARRRAKKAVPSPPSTPPQRSTVPHPHTQRPTTAKPQGVQKAAAPRQKKRRARWVKSYRRMPTRSRTRAALDDVHVYLADTKGKVMIPSLNGPLSYDHVLNTTSHMALYEFL